MEQEFQEIDLREIIHIVLAKWWVILIFIILSTGITAYVTMNYVTPMYSANSTLFIGKESDSIAGIDIKDLQIDDQLVTDYRELIKTRLVTEEVISRLNLDVSVSKFIEHLQVSTIKDSRFIHISYEDASPETAAIITNELSEELVAKAVDIVGVKNVQIVDKAIEPTLPVSPNVKLNIAVAGVLGAMLALFCIFLLHMMDNTIKREEDIENYLGLSVLGVVPKFEGDERNDKKKKLNFFG